MSKRFRLGSKKAPESVDDVLEFLKHEIYMYGVSYREKDGVVRNPEACHAIRCLRLARDYVRDFSPSAIAVLNDLGDEE